MRKKLEVVRDQRSSLVPTTVVRIPMIWNRQMLLLGGMQAFALAA